MASTGQGFLGYDMYVYCLNNPVCMHDKEGLDAIYVSDMSDDGLPVVGHAVLYIQDSNQKWYKTEYTGRFPDKSTATVTLVEVSQDVIDKIISGGQDKNKSHVYISGDFSGCLAKAEYYKGTNYSGYNLLTNNCKNYTQEILSYGKFDSKLVSYVASNNNSPVPSDHVRELSIATSISNLWKGCVQGAKELWGKTFGGSK